MILSWRNCIKLKIVPNTFRLAKIGEVNDIQTEAEVIKETITNKYDIIRDNISHNKILTEPAKVKIKDIKIIPLGHPLRGKFR